MYSKTFDCDCCIIQLDIFLCQLMHVMGEIIPRNAAKKFLSKPINVCTTDFREVASKFFHCYSIEEMHALFMELSPEEQHHVIMELELFELEFNQIPKDTMVCVPTLPRNYIKPFFANLLTPQNILTEFNNQ